MRPTPVGRIWPDPSDSLPPMTKILSLALLIAGIVLIIYGISASESISSDFSRLFTGSPTDRTVWLLIGGIVAAAIGAGGLFSNFRRT